MRRTVYRTRVHTETVRSPEREEYSLDQQNVNKKNPNIGELNEIYGRGP